MFNIHSKTKKIVLIILVALIFSFILIPQKVVYAGVTGVITDWISGKAIGGVAWFINLLIGFVAGIAFTLAGDLVNFTLKINGGIIGQPVVSIGWNIILQFTNLGFVLAIIVIAFATILRMESYGMKKTLGKLVAAALLVNFSLVIAGIPLSVANVITKMFQDKAQLGPVEAATTFARAFEISKFLAVGKTNEPFFNCGWSTVVTVTDSGEDVDTGADIPNYPCIKNNEGDEIGGAKCKCNVIPPKKEEMFAGVTGIGKSLFVGLASILFTIVFTIIAAISLFALAIMLLIRFIALGILLVLSPIVWLLWIFPGTQEYWKKWWNEFIRWTFFAPAVMFFLYLAVQSTKGMAALTFSSKTNEGLEASLLQSGASGLVGNMVIIIGFLIGGLFVANKMSITFAKTAYGWAEGAVKGTGAWAGRKTKQYGTAPLRATLWKDEQGKRTQSMGEKLVGWGKNRPTLAKWTGFGLLARGITRLETTGGENILKQHQKTIGGMTSADLKAAALTASGPRKVAVMQELQKRKSLGDVNAKELITEGNKALFGRYRQGVAWDDVEHGAKMNVKIAEELRKTGKATLESVREFVKTYKGKDIEPSVIKDLYSGKSKLGLSRESVMELGGVFADALAEVNHQMVPKIVPTMDAKERDTFSRAYGPAVRNTGDSNKIKAWDNTLSNFAMGLSAEMPSAGAAPSSPTA